VFGCLIQGNTPTGTWGPAWIERGIGGSEQAAVYLAAALQRRGWQVEVYGAFHHVQKRPIIGGKETYYVGKRDLEGSIDALQLLRTIHGSDAEVRQHQL
jgi:hypothetical protein